MDECRTKLESTLAQSGLRENGQTQATPQPIYDPAAALMKQQAGMDLDRKRQVNVTNAFRQREAANLRKINALKTSTDHQPRHRSVKGKSGKGGKGSSKSHNKGKANNYHKKQNQYYVVDEKSKQWPVDQEVVTWSDPWSN